MEKNRNWFKTLFGRTPALSLRRTHSQVRCMVVDGRRSTRDIDSSTSKVLFRRQHVAKTPKTAKENNGGRVRRTHWRR